MDTMTITHNGYTITTECGVERGLFFRNPLQKVDFSTWSEGRFSAYQYLYRLKNPLRKIYEIIIGNRDVVKDIYSWSDRCDWAGFEANILCSPIYFKRKYRKLYASTSKKVGAASIRSYGYESEFNTCSGCCVIEKTRIKFSDGRCINHIIKSHYHYTYAHIVEEFVDGGELYGQEE